MRTIVYFFSATGNTARAVQILGLRLEAAGHGVRTVNLGSESSDLVLPVGSDRVVVAFPVLAWWPPAMVLRAIQRLPGGDTAGGGARQAFVLAVDGGGGGPGARRAADALRRKGYRVLHAAGASYPENWAQFGAVSHPGEVDRKLEAGDAMVEDFADRVLYGATASQEIPRFEVLSAVVGGLFTLFGRRFLGKLWYANHRCTACGLCERTCPVGTIVLRPGLRPEWKHNCEACNRCINVCPVQAINPSWANLVLQLGGIGGLSALGLGAVGILSSHLEFLSEPWNWVLTGSLDLGILVGAHALTLGPVDALIGARLRRLRSLDGLFAATWTNGVSRYLAPGFRPEARRKGNV